MKKIGDVLKELRLINGLTQTQVAEFLEVDQSLITKIESGERNIKSIHLERLCNLYGVSVTSLENEEFNCIKIAYRAKEVSNEDLNVIAEVKELALNLRFMEDLYENNR